MAQNSAGEKSCVILQGGHRTPVQAFFTAGTGAALNVFHCKHVQQMCYNSTGKTYAPNSAEQLASARADPKCPFVFVPNLA